MKTGLVIINYNDYENTINLTEEVSKYTSIDEIVIVDNDSSNHDIEKLKKIKNNKVHVIGLTSNLGYSSGMNEGCKYLIQKYGSCNIILSNSDISIPSNNVIKSLVKNMKNPEIAAIMPKVLEHGVFKYGWKLTSPKEDLLLNIPVFSKLYKNKFIQYNESHFNDPLPVVDCLYGCFFMIKSDILKEINYFDTNVFLYHEENILARKLKSKKLLSVVDTSVFVEHKHNATIGTNVSRLNKYKIYKASQFYYEKNYNNANKLTMSILKFFYNISLFIKETSIKLKEKSK